MVLRYIPFLASVSLLSLFNHLSIIHSLFRLHLDFEIELSLQPVCELHFYILILFQWSVFSCGHCICCQCAWVLLRQAGVGPRHRNVHVKCPMCRIPTIAQEISYVSTARTQKEESEENIAVKVSVKNTFTLFKWCAFFRSLFSYLSMSLVFLHFTFEMSPSANSLSTLLLVVCVFFKV